MEAIRETHLPEQYLTFWVGGEEYAIGILRVREIIEYPAVTRVPNSPPWIRGVINLRGSVVPVIDLAVKLGFEFAPATRRTCIVLVEVELEGELTVLGVVADGVGQVLELAPADIEPSPSFGTRVHTHYLTGMGKVERGFVLLLDIDRALARSEVLEAAAASAGETAESELTA
ncbi:MAG TPA: chemotaxis protein CheW [Thermoanaerobaculia bacterium]|nr:chemotaxis protein CheW [Thermoanaerobaculia bacterium]